MISSWLIRFFAHDSCHFLFNIILFRGKSIYEHGCTHIFIPAIKSIRFL